MGSRDLRRQIAELRAIVEAHQPSRVSDELRAYFADGIYDGHREQIITALLDGRMYTFDKQLPGDPAGCPSHFYISRPHPNGPPQILRIQYIAEWRKHKYGVDENAVAPLMRPSWERQQGTATASSAVLAPANSPEASELDAPAMPMPAPAEPELASELEGVVEPEPPAAPSIEQLRAKAQRLADTQRLIFGRVDPRSLL